MVGIKSKIQIDGDKNGNDGRKRIVHGQIDGIVERNVEIYLTSDWNKYNRNKLYRY